MSGDRFLTATAVAAAAVALGVAIGLRDPDALGLAVVVGAGLLLTRVRRRLGAAIMLVLFINIGFWTFAAVASNISHDEAPGPVALPGLLAAISLAGMGAAALTLVTPPPVPSGPRMRRSALYGLGAGVVTVAVMAAAPGLANTAEPEPGDLVIKMKNSRFAPEELRASPGRVSLFVANPDLFWHTVTIPDLDVDVRLPVGAARRTAFVAEAGRYEYLCRVPGHGRMRGILTVAPPSPAPR